MEVQINSSSAWSQNLAQNLGERHVRSVSRVFGDGLAVAFDRQNTGLATDLAHVLMLGMAAVGASSKGSWGQIALLGGLVFAALWAFGQSETATDWYQ